MYGCKISIFTPNIKVFKSWWKRRFSVTMDSVYREGSHKKDKKSFKVNIGPQPKVSKL